MKLLIPHALFIVLPLLALLRPPEDPASPPGQGLPSRGEAASGEEDLRTRLDHDAVLHWLKKFDSLSLPASRNLRILLSSGGPWTSALVGALQEPGVPGTPTAR